jgi:hypothetical protein
MSSAALEERKGNVARAGATLHLNLRCPYMVSVLLETNPDHQEITGPMIRNVGDTWCASARLTGHEVPRGAAAKHVGD